MALKKNWGNFQIFSAPWGLNQTLVVGSGPSPPQKQAASEPCTLPLGKELPFEKLNRIAKHHAQHGQSCNPFPTTYHCPLTTVPSVLCMPMQFHTFCYFLLRKPSPSRSALARTRHKNVEHAVNIQFGAASPFFVSPRKAIPRSKNRPIEGENHQKPCT